MSVFPRKKSDPSDGEIGVPQFHETPIATPRTAQRGGVVHVFAPQSEAPGKRVALGMTYDRSVSLGIPWEAFPDLCL